MRFSGAFETATHLEIIRGRETDDDTVAAFVEVGKRMGKEMVVVADGVAG
jgi:3-hydroxyacyl-CoA dehydrogenase